MSPSRPLLIFLLLFLNPALGYPVAKRLSPSEISEDVLAGTDFLSVFMKTSPVRSVAPSFKYGSIFGIKTRNSDYSETNSVVQKNKEDIHPYSSINLKGEDALESDSHEAADNQAQLEEEIIKTNSQANSFTQETMTAATDRNITDTTTSSPATTTITDDTAASTYYDLEDEHPSIVQGFRDDRSTKPTVTQYWSDPQMYPQPPTPASNSSSDQPLQVISVRVSSSVVRHSHKVEDALKEFESEKITKPASTLITQEQPTNTAIQRSHLNVEEALLPEDHMSYHDVQSSAKTQPSLRISNTGSYQFSNLDNKPVSNKDNSPTLLNSDRNENSNSKSVEQFSSDGSQSEVDEEERKIQQTDFLKIQRNQTKTANQGSGFQIYLKDGEDRRKDYTEEEAKPQDTRNNPQALPYQFKYQPQPRQPLPTGFQDGGYLKEEGVKKNADFVEEKIQPYDSRDLPQALAFQYNPENPQLSPVSYHTSVSSATSGSRVQFYRGPPSYRRGSTAESVQRAVLAEPKGELPFAVPTPSKQIHQGEPVEKSYEVPEQNYEIDESISVVTNGRAHGVQIPTPTPTRESSENDKDDDNKSGYVVEGRNFRKYRVEERTADGFIVGEYGVVSHDDGSLRGVRYTADGTINPRLIYDALVKFLSLK